jgi:hypothetical protein
MQYAAKTAAPVMMLTMVLFAWYDILFSYDISNLY